MKKEGEQNFKSLSAHILGIVSLVLAFFNPIPGFVLAIVGLVQSSKQKDSMSRKAKKLNTIALVVSLIMIVLAVLISLNVITLPGGIPQY